jgi:hypothetical protein
MLQAKLMRAVKTASSFVTEPNCQSVDITFQQHQSDWVPLLSTDLAFSTVITRK